MRFCFALFPKYLGSLIMSDGYGEPLLAMDFALFLKKFDFCLVTHPFEKSAWSDPHRTPPPTKGLAFYRLA